MSYPRSYRVYPLSFPDQNAKGSLISRPKSCPHIKRSFWMKPITPECLVAHVLYSVQVIKESVQLLPINITLQGFLLLCVIYIHAVYTYIKAYMLKDKIINSSSTLATHPTKHTQPHKWLKGQDYSQDYRVNRVWPGGMCVCVFSFSLCLFTNANISEPVSPKSHHQGSN